MEQDSTAYNMKKADLAVEVYKSLRMETIEYINSVRKLEFGCFAGMAAAYYFLFGALFKGEFGHDKSTVLLLLIVPIVLPLYCLIKVYAINTHMRLITDYLTSLEMKFDLGGFWETFTVLERRRSKNSRIEAIKYTNYLAFGLLVVAGIVVGGLAWLSTF